MQRQGTPARRVGRDPHLLVALALAPVGWGLVALFTARSVALWPPPSWAGDSPMRLLLLVIAYPVLEEIVFRGWLQPSLARRWPCVWPSRPGEIRISVANVVTSALFTAAHLVHQPPLLALATFAPSLVFGHLRERFGRTLPAIVMHAVYNAGFFWLLR